MKKFLGLFALSAGALLMTVSCGVFFAEQENNNGTGRLLISFGDGDASRSTLESAPQDRPDFAHSTITVTLTNTDNPRDPAKDVTVTFTANGTSSQTIEAVPGTYTLTLKAVIPHSANPDPFPFAASFSCEKTGVTVTEGNTQTVPLTLDKLETALKFDYISGSKSFNIKTDNSGSAYLTAYEGPAAFDFDKYGRLFMVMKNNIAADAAYYEVVRVNAFKDGAFETVTWGNASMWSNMPPLGGLAYSASGNGGKGRLYFTYGNSSSPDIAYADYDIAGIAVVPVDRSVMDNPLSNPNIAADGDYLYLIKTDYLVQYTVTNGALADPVEIDDSPSFIDLKVVDGTLYALTTDSTSSGYFLKRKDGGSMVKVNTEGFSWTPSRFAGYDKDNLFIIGNDTAVPQRVFYKVSRTDGTVTGTVQDPIIYTTTR